MQKIFSLFNIVVIATVVIIGCSAKKEPSDTQPQVFRSVLDQRARMVTAALPNDLWVAYSAQDGSLYKIWKGGVKFDGAVYTTVHGPQPTSLGYAYFVSENEENPWTITSNGQTIKPMVQYRGHRFDDGSVVFNYELRYDRNVILVQETPKYVKRGNQDGLERMIILSNVPANTTATLALSATSMQVENDFSASGNFMETGREKIEFDRGAVWQVSGNMTMDGTAPASFRVFFHPGFDRLEIKSVAELKEEEHPGKTAIYNSDCKTCHNEKVKTIGPAYEAIARRYANTEETVEILAGKIIKGGSGVWGEIPMTPHAALSIEDASAMARYILSLDDGGGSGTATKTIPLRFASELPDFSGENNGLAGSLYMFTGDQPNIEVVAASQPAMVGKVSQIHVMEREDFQILENFLIEFKGKIIVPKTASYSFRLVSDDGSKLIINDKEIIDHWGLHGPSPKDGEVYLEKGSHAIKILYYQKAGGAAISFQWFNTEKEAFELVPEAMLRHTLADFKAPVPFVPGSKLVKSIPGDQIPLESVHPAFDLYQAIPDGFEPMVGGMDFFSDGSMVITTWDSVGGVYRIFNPGSKDPAQITVKQIAGGLAEPLGVKVVDDTVYVLQKQELTQLIDHTGDGVADEYRTISNAWRVSANFHEFAFGLVYKDGYFYGTLATAILPGGASAQPQIPDRGKVVQISRADGTVKFIAHGLRTPNGIGIGADGEMFVADNQGDWLPSSKIVHVKEGAFYGSRSVDPIGTKDLQETLPVVWLPQDEIGNSPSEPSYLNVDPYKGQMIHGEVTHGGIKRVFVEKVGGNYQGAVFRFTQGLQSGINRIDWGPDGHLYVGGIGSSGNWSHTGKKWFGVERLEYNGQSVFEMLAVRSRADGFEIEFTEPIKEGQYVGLDDFEVQQWYYLPTEEYGGPKLGLTDLPIKSFHWSADRKKIFLELAGLKPNHMVYFHIKRPFVSANDQELWTTEAWYTQNAIGTEPGFRNTQKVAHNTIMSSESAAGWKLLFDGKSTGQIRNYNGSSLGSGWKVDNGTLALTGKLPGEDGWQSKNGGDILITDKPYRNYELYLEWKLATNGNSGVIYNTQEGEKYQYCWETGMEMQILHNAGHPDGQIENHRAGDLYDLIPSKFVTVLAPGEWNRVRLVVNNGKVEHWLNGYKVVNYELWTAAWDKMIAESKLASMEDFGTVREGHIVLQDHGDKVWFRNIKIKETPNQ